MIDNNKITEAVLFVALGLNLIIASIYPEIVTLATIHGSIVLTGFLIATIIKNKK